MQEPVRTLTNLTHAMSLASLETDELNYGAMKVNPLSVVSYHACYNGLSSQKYLIIIIVLFVS